MAKHTESQSVQIARGGITTSLQFCNLMSALITDLLIGKVTPQVANAVANAGGKMLKIIELEHRYGTVENGSSRKMLKLVRSAAAQE